LGNKKIAQALQASGATLEVHSDHFNGDERDDVWPPEVGRRNWVLLTKDARIRYRTNERQALMNAGVRGCMLVSGNLSGDDMASTFVRALPAIRRFASLYPAPFIAKIYRTGAVRMWLKGPN